MVVSCVSAAVLGLEGSVIKVGFWMIAEAVLIYPLVEVPVLIMLVHFALRLGRKYFEVEPAESVSTALKQALSQ